MIKSGKRREVKAWEPGDACGMTDLVSALLPWLCTVVKGKQLKGESECMREEEVPVDTLLQQMVT